MSLKIDGKELLTLKEACKFLNISESTIRRWIKSKKIKAIQVGRPYFFDKDDLKKLFEK